MWERAVWFHLPTSGPHTETGTALVHLTAATG